MTEIETNSIGQEYKYAVDPTSLTKFLTIILGISLGISVLSLLSDFMQMSLLSAGRFSQSAAEANDSRQKAISILYLIAYIVTGIAFLKWIYRANKNCHGFGAQGMEFTPGWSIGFYFIPFLNLYKPYRAMKEIWNISENPNNWNNKNGSTLLRSWWALWIISGFLWQTSFRMSLQANTISSLKALTTVYILSGIIDIPLYIVSVSLISTISNKQEKLVRKNAQFGKDPHNKNDLIRSLAKQRIRADPMAAAMGVNENTVDSLGIMQLTGLPESTIATIVETYATLKKQGTQDGEIFARIEAHRATIGAGQLPQPLTLENYVAYRIAIELSWSHIVGQFGGEVKVYSDA